VMAKEIDTKQVHYEWYIIKTSSTAYQIWKLIIVSMSFFTSFTYAYYAAFLDFMSEEEITAFENQEILFSMLFTIDIIVNFLTEYHYPMTTDI